MKKTVLILLLLSIAPLSIFANAHDCEPNAPIGRACRYRSGDHDPHGMVKTGKCAEDKKGNK